MSLAIKCDRCGLLYKEYEEGAYSQGVQTICRINVDGAYYITDHKPYDLCPDCMSEFENWLSRGKHVKDDITTIQDEEK